MAAGTAIARIDRSGAILSLNARRSRSCRHAVGAGQLSGHARGAVSDLARQHAKARGAPERVRQAWRPGESVLQFSVLFAIFGGALVAARRRVAALQRSLPRT